MLVMRTLPATYATSDSWDGSTANSLKPSPTFACKLETHSPSSDLLLVAPSENPPVDCAPNQPKRRALYPCPHPTCDRMLTTPYTRQLHMSSHREKVRKAFLCTLGCGEAFTRRHDRQRHEVALHSEQCTHNCKRCGRFFSSVNMLFRHFCSGPGDR